MKRMLALLLSLTLVLALAACGGNTSGKNTSGQTGSSTPSDSSGDKAAGSVYYLNFKPEADQPGRPWLRPTPKRPVCQ